MRPFSKYLKSILKVDCSQQGAHKTLEKLMGRLDPDGSSEGVVLQAVKDFVDVKHNISQICYDIALECSKHKPKGAIPSSCKDHETEEKGPEALQSFLATITSQVRRPFFTVPS